MFDGPLHLHVSCPLTAGYSLWFRFYPAGGSQSMFTSRLLDRFVVTNIRKTEQKVAGWAYFNWIIQVTNCPAAPFIVAGGKFRRLEDEWLLS
jgi:hypothetical protein